jgi:uncharacterized repeat protein (TIGR01451 family)
MRLFRVLALGSLVVSALVAGYVREKSQRGLAPREVVAVASRDGHVTVQAAGRGKPFLNLADGREMSAVYRGDHEAAAALRDGVAQARTLATADFDHNGTPDVVAGYAHGGAGLLTVQRGNPDAYAPTDDSVFVRMQQGYDPEPLVPGADVYRVPEPPELLVTGHFTNDSHNDVLVAARNGGLYLLAGDGRGGLGSPRPIPLPGVVTALAAGQFRAADAMTDIAVGVSGPAGSGLLVFDDAARGFAEAVVRQPLAGPARAVEFGGLDDDPFMDVAVADGRDILVIHGWGRKERVAAASRVERIQVGSPVLGLAVGNFAWDRGGPSEIAALSADGAIHVLQNAKADTRPFSEAEAARRRRGMLRPLAPAAAFDVESVASWTPGRPGRWRLANWLPPGDCVDDGEGDCVGDAEFARLAPGTPLLTSRLSYREMNDLVVLGGGRRTIEIVHPKGPADRSPMGRATPTTILGVESAPVAVLALPRKINGVTDVIMLRAASTAFSGMAAAPNTTITVDRTDDTAGAALTAASACTAAANDCSLRGAFQFANNVDNNNTTISLPANTYVLSINGTTTNGCADNTTGDLGANQSMALLGAGAATTIIRQTGTGPANDGDRIMCMNETFLENLVYNFSGVTFTGGRDGAAGGGVQVFGGGAIIGGERGNALTLTGVTFVNNWTVGPGLGGGAIQITGGDLTVTNSTFGGANAPGLYTDRASVSNANQTGTSGAGINYTPSSPQHTGGTGILTVTGTTFSRNVANSGSAGGGGADLYIFAFASPGGIGSGSASFSTSTFTNNQAPTANGGGIVVESLPTTVATSSFTSNSVGNRGGGIYVGGASLTLNGTAAPGVTFTGNTATNAGSSISTAAAVTVQGTSVTIGGDIEVSTGGTWTNDPGSTLSPTNVALVGGTLNMNNSIMNVSGNLTMGPAPVVGATFNGNSGTVNIAGNFSFAAGGSPATAFNAGTGTFNFNGTGLQSISNNANITFNHLTDSNVTQPLTLNNSLAVNGNLTVNGANAILSPAAAAVISGTGTLTGTGTARVSRIAATADFLSQYTITNKALANLRIDYNGAGAQTVNNTVPYSDLAISGSGTKTLQGNTTISGSLTIAAATLASGNFTFTLGGNWVNNGTFAPGTGTVTFAGGAGIQTLTGNTTFFNLTLNNPGATISFGATTTTVANDLVATAGTMDGGTSTIIFTGATDNAGAIGGVAAKNFHSLQINSPAAISNTAGGTITIENNYTNTGTFSQAPGQTTIFATDNSADGTHALSGAGTTTFGNVTIDAANTVDAGTHNFSVSGVAFTVAGVFNGNAGTVSFNGATAQTIAGDGAKNFNGLLVNNPSGVQVANGAGVVDAFVGGLLTLTTDLTVATGAVLQQGGTSTGAADVLGTVRRTDLGSVARSFGNLNNAITINSGTAPAQLDVTLVKAAPGTFPAGVKVVPRQVSLTPVGGGGFSATVRLRYIDPAELATVTESRLTLWKNIAGVWTPQGGTPDLAGNFVTHTGVTSFSDWAIAEGSDLTLTKANNAGGAAVTGQPWNWTLTAANTGAPATFADGQTILTDNLPTAGLTYGAVSLQSVSNVSGIPFINCAIVSSNLTCTASGGSVTFASDLGASSLDVVFSATPTAPGTYQNPRPGGGIAEIDPAGVVVESNESNNAAAANTVTATKADTTTTITSDSPDPSVVGQPVTVQWSVTVNPPGSVAVPLTGTVTVSDGTAQCVADVSLGACNITFTSPGARSITATYAGDISYNGSASTPVTAHQVDKADTTTTITSDAPDPSTPGQSVIVQWTVTVNAPGSGTPTGTVTVSDSVDSCNAPVEAGQCTVALTTTGNRTLSATYGGDLNVNGSSDTESHDVCPSTVVTTAADSGAGSLREVAGAACAGSTITFDAGVFATPQTITLTTGELLIDRNLTIDARLRQVTVSGNNASRAFNVGAGTTLTVIGLTISGSQGAGSGGGILNNGTLTLVGSTLSGNAATADGGAIGASAGATSVTLINSTISGNTANGSGGGIAILGGTFTSINSTLTNNRADSDGNETGTGGGVFHGGATAILHNTIVAGNLNEDGAAGVPDDISGTVDPASSFNLVGTGSGGLIGGVNGNQVDVTKPGLGPLASNGGTTHTHALLPGSPAIESGGNANLPADTFDLDGDNDTAESWPVDQRGTSFPRAADSADADVIQSVDIGAVEAHPSVQDTTDRTTAEDTAAPQIVIDIGDGTGSLIGSATATSDNPALIPNANLTISGTGSSRTLDITPSADANSPSDGTATITVTVTATNGQTATDTFVVTVTEVNDAPIAVADAVGDIAEDSGVYSIPLATLLGNDIAGPANETAQVLGIVGVSAPTGGTVQINGANVEFTPAPNYFGPATFTYTLADNGTTNGVPDPRTANTTVSFNVTAVNDPPVDTVPGPQSTPPDTPLVFSIGNGNPISVADPDAATSAVQVTLTATNGTLTLGGTSGLSFAFSDGNGTGAGDGTADGTMTFRGTLANVNAALNGMAFTPTTGFTGAASVLISANDLGNTGSGGPQLDTDTVSVQVVDPSNTELSITKTDGVTTATAGGSVTYVITAANAGPGVATGATVMDTFPAGLTCTWTCVGAGGGTCTAAGSGNINQSVNMPAGGSVIYTASCSIAASATGALSNTATVSAPAGVTDPNLANNAATDTDTLTRQADLAITKTDGVTEARPGRSVTYTIVASNAGPSDATGVTVTDIFPAPLTCTWTCAGAGGGTCSAAGSGNINQSVNLPAGGSVIYTASCSIDISATGTLSNTAAISAPAGVTDPDPANNSATDTDTLRADRGCSVNGDGLEAIVTSPGPGGGPHVQALSLTRAQLASFFAYDPQFGGGVTVACGDVTGDGVAEIITGAGAGGGPHVRAFRLASGGLTEVASFFAYDPAFAGGVTVAVGDVTGDGVAEIITGAGAGGGPHVRAFSLASGGPTEVASFFAYDPAFAGGVTVAVGDVTGDGVADIITGAGAGGGPHVRAFSLASGAPVEVASFFAYDPAFAGGVTVAVGDVTGDGLGDIVTGAGAGGGPHVRAFSLASGGPTEAASFFAYDPAFPGGVFVAVGDLNDDGVADIITGAGPGGGPHLQVFDGATLAPLASFFAYDPAFSGGVRVGR